MGKDPPAIWNDELVAIFCDLCIIEVENGNRPHSHFTREGWTNLVRDFPIKTGNCYTKKQLKNKWDSLKSEWKVWKELKGKETGLGWDHNKQTVDASDEWWEGKIKKNADYAKFRKKGISPALEERLDRLFASVSATGMHAWAPSSSVPLPRSTSIGTSIGQAEAGQAEASEDEAIADSEDVIEPEEGKKRKSKRLENARLKGVATKKEKLGGSAKLSKQIDRMVEAFESRSTATSMITQKLQERETTSIKETLKVIKSLPGVGTTTPLWHFATDLMLNKDKREAFAVMEDDPEAMKSWLLYQMNKN